jgi:CheY-like chemotaxis protein
VLANQQHLGQLKKAMLDLVPPGTEKDSTGHLRILLVEDDESIKTTTTEIIRQIGHSVEAHSEPQSALRALDERAFDVLITDVGLNEISGLELAKRARGIAPNLQIVFVTGAILEEDIHGARVIQKPYDVSQLAAVLSEIAAIC